MTARFTLDAPLASADTWAGRPAPSPAKKHGFRFDIVSCSQCGEDFGPGDHGFSHCVDHEPTEEMLARGRRVALKALREAQLDAQAKGSSTWVDDDATREAIWHDNMARRDAAAREYGEPETPHEFYAGRPGSKAERIVLDCLRELRAIPEIDQLYAHELMDAISKAYLATAKESEVRMRRIAAMMKIDVEMIHGL